MANIHSGTPTLQELQRWLAARVLRTPPPDTAASVGGGLEDWLVLPDGVDVAERLAVHGEGYPARVREALAEVFPAVVHIVGEHGFTELARRYVRSVPLPSYNLNDAGANLPRFLHWDATGEGFPFLPDLAELEWRVARAFHSCEAPPLDPAPLEAWRPEDWERAILRFQPSVAVVFSPWPIHEIWQCREMPVEEIDVDLHSGPQRVLVHRAGLAVHCELLPAAEAGALSALIEGHRLGEVIARLVAEGQEAHAVLKWFACWMEGALIVSCSVGPPPEDHFESRA